MDNKQIKIDLCMIATAMCCLDVNIRSTYGRESDQWYAFKVAADAQEKLIDSVPGAREFILEMKL